MKRISSVPGKFLRATTVVLALIASVSLALPSPAAAQKEKKKKKDAAANDGAPVVPLSDEQQIDNRIAEMLGAWQIGDVDRLHQTYGDDVVFVSGIWEPPVFGWANYLPIYQKMRARMQQVRMDRVNTYIKVDGAIAWSSYQWEFVGNVDGQATSSRGQTTLVLEKRNNKWVIVHNHTSAAQAAPTLTTQPQAAPNTPPTQPSKPPRR